MRKNKIRCAFFVLVSCLVSTSLKAQDSSSIYYKIYNFPDRLFGRINSKSQDLQNKFSKQTEKYLTRLSRHEKKLKKQLWKKDSTAAKEMFGDVDARYVALRSKMTEPASQHKLPNVYSGQMDSMKTALNFLGRNNLLQQSPQIQQQLQGVMQNYTQLQGNLNGTDQINKYLQQRQHQLKIQVEKFGLTKQYRKFQKDVYYYRSQIDEYKKELEDPQKIEAKLLQLVTKIPAFKNFFANHSELSNLFRFPGNNDPLNGASVSIAGLQTRAMVQQDLLQRFGTVPNLTQMVHRGIQAGQLQLSQLKNKLDQLGNGGGDIDIPNFKPNSQKTKSFFDRVEFGTNFQSTKSSNFFPVTTDIGLNAGYKLNDKSIVGLGASYKMGWGKDIRHISITHEGIGLRSFIDWKLKGNFFITGGYEQNYRVRFDNLQQLRNEQDNWQQSALLGLSKKYNINKKIKGNIQMMYDFLHQQHIPRTQPVVFRFGYKI